MIRRVPRQGELAGLGGFIRVHRKGVPTHPLVAIGPAALDREIPQIYIFIIISSRHFGSENNDYFAFNTSSITTPVTSVTLTIPTFGEHFGGNLNYDVSNASSLFNTLSANQNVDIISAPDIYAGLQSGTILGSTTVSPYGYPLNAVTVTLDASTFNSIVRSDGGNFVAGGSLDVSPVPLPGTFPLFGSAIVGMVVLARRRAKKAA